ncbi:MAG: imidazole glycerol phosphate synthase subunit HisH, partial [Pseudomonadota bacterium]
MLTALIDYDSGNLHSAQKAFERMAADIPGEQVVVTSDADMVRKADRIVLPGDGAFPACKAALTDRRGVFAALVEAVEQDAKPFLGICVGMQMMATHGHEYRHTPGLNWVAGDVRAITPADPALKVPHMGWND